MYFLLPDCLSSHDSVRWRPSRKTRLPLCRCSATPSARLPKALMLNHSVCSCGSPALFFQHSLLAMVKVAMAVPPAVYFISGSLPRYPISRGFYLGLVSLSVEVEMWRETMNQASPAFSISRRRAARKRSSADGDGDVSGGSGCREPGDGMTDRVRGEVINGFVRLGVTAVDRTNAGRGHGCHRVSPCCVLLVVICFRGKEGEGSDAKIQTPP